MTMRAVVVSKFGDKSLPLHTDVAIPKPAANEVLIKVKAAGINPVDTYILQGNYNDTQVPYTPGRDGSGVVEEVGDNVKGFHKGDRVIAISNQSGTFAEYCLAKQLHVSHLHNCLSFYEGAGIGIPYYTAYTAIFNKANVKPGETVLVHGASGGVGIAAVQILKAHGCTVIGTASTHEGMDIVTKEGADYVFNHRDNGYMQTIKSQVTSGRGVDVVIEMLSNVNLQHDITIMAKNGRIIIIGCRGTIEINPRMLMGNGTSIIGHALMATEEYDWKQAHAALFAGQRLGWLKPRVYKVYKLEEAGKGFHDVIENSGTFGKLILDPTL